MSKAPKMPCNGCGRDVVQIGDFYMLKPEIRRDQLGLGWHDNLCLEYLETRLDRKLSVDDLLGGILGGLPTYPWSKPRSMKLQCRIFGNGVTKRKPYRWKRYFASCGFPAALARKIGEYRETEGGKNG